MTVGDLAELAARNLREAILRNSLTTMGIAVGVASLVAMLSLGVGLQNLVNRRLERSGLFDSVLVRPSPQITGRPDGFGGPPRPAAPAVPPRPLDVAARQSFQQLPHVVEVYPDLRFTADLRFGDQGRITQAVSLPVRRPPAIRWRECRAISFLRPTLTK